MFIYLLILILSAVFFLSGIKLAFCIDSRYLSSEDSHFVDLVTEDLVDFKTNSLYKVVLLFPPVNNYLRLLIHKTVEDFPDLHSFSVGEGNQRQTVVCWTQALIDRDEAVEFDYLRPPGMRGRGRARFKGNNSPSPGLGNSNGSGDNGDRWSHDRYSPELGTRRTPTYNDRQTRPGAIISSRSPCQQNDDRSSPVGRPVRTEEQRTPVAVNDGSSSSVKKSERPRNRRPDVQVYVPRARRQQPGQNGRENQASPDHSEVTPRVTPVRQKKKEMERYVPRGRLEQQNKENSSSFQSIKSHPPSEIPHVNEESVGNTKNVHKKIRVEGKWSENFPADISASGFSEQVQDNSEMQYNDKSICDNKVIDVDKQVVDSRPEVNEDYNDSSVDITTNTSKYEDALHGNTNADAVKHFIDNCPEKTDNFREVNDEWLNDKKGLSSDSNDLNNVSNPITPAFTAISSSDTTNKLQESRDKCTELLTGSINKETESIKVKSESENIVGVTENKKGDISTLGATADEELTNKKENNEGREKLADVSLTQLKNEEEYTACSVEPVQDSQDMRTKTYSEEDGDDIKSAILRNSVDDGENFPNSDSHKNTNVESDVGEETENLPDDNIDSDEVMKDGTNTEDIHQIKDCEIPDESLTEESNAKESAVEINNENSVEAMDCTISGGETMSKQEIDKEDMEMFGNLEEQPDDDEKELEDGNQREAEKVALNINKSKGVSNADQSDTVTNNSSQSKEEEVDEDSWDAMFDDDGECLDPTAMEELTKTVGKVKIQKSKKINYLDYQPKDKSNFDFTQYEHIIEIYDFPVDFVTRDLIIAFQAFMSRGFDLKWVDDTHALGIFSSAIAAQDALQLVHPLLKVRPLSQASKQSQNKAKRCTEFLQPYKPRPETSAMAARRLVAGALGLATGVSKEKREMERKQLKEAKAKKRQERQNRENIWEYGKCAMDEET